MRYFSLPPGCRPRAATSFRKTPCRPRSERTRSVGSDLPSVQFGVTDGVTTVGFAVLAIRLVGESTGRQPLTSELGLAAWRS